MTLTIVIGLLMDIGIKIVKITMCWAQ